MGKQWAYILILLVAAVATRFIGLSTPNEVVFDEVHFGKFVTAYCCTGERVFDIHPPHAKLLIAGVGRIVGYTGGFSFDHIGQEFGTVPVWALRVWPAVMGVVLPMLLFGLVRLVRGSWEAAFLAGLVGVFDNALVVQTRVIALDGTLLVAQLGAIAAFLTGDRFSGKRKLFWYVMAGVLAGLAVGVKFTGLVALSVIGMIVFYRLWRSLARTRDRVQAGEWFVIGLVVLFSAAVSYIFGWWLHFQLLTEPGSGDVWGIPTGVFVTDLIEVHRDMLSSNYNLVATHPDASAWWSWPFMLKSVFYWSSPSGATIYFLGNPAVWWGAFVLFVVAATAFVRTQYRLWVGKRHFSFSATDAVADEGLWILLFAFFVSFVPLINVPRVLFLYHYLTPLLFTILFGLVWIDRRLSAARRWPIFVSMSIFAVVMFLVFSPITYGFVVSSSWNQSLFWLSEWR